MHKLGTELGVKGMSLYSHIDSKDALLDGLVEIMSAETAPAPAPGADWRGPARSYPPAPPPVMRPPPAAPPPRVGPPASPPRRPGRLARPPPDPPRRRS